MRIPKVTFFIYKNRDSFKLKKSFSRIYTNANKLFNCENKITGLLPDSMRKNKDTGVTTAQLIELILHNL